MKKQILFLFIFCLFIIPLFESVLSRADEPTPPNQPTSGPGSSDYIHEGLKESRYKWGAHQYWIFEPDLPKPESAPLIVFNHGWSAFNPMSYKEWINHIVKKGNIVIFPRYQLGFSIGYKWFSSNAIQAVKDAIHELEKGNHVRPLLDKFAIVGHSLGGGITAYMAAEASDVGLPIPKAIMPVQPAIPFGPKVDLNKIPAETLMVVIVGQNDTIVGDKSGKTIFYNSTQISLSQKDYIIQITDRYGEPDLVANHIAPICYPNTNTVDAMDYYSTWKLFDALIDYAFYGVNKDYCLGNTTQQRYMGLWSDGKPVKELIITDSP